MQNNAMNTRCSFVTLELLELSLLCFLPELRTAGGKWGAGCGRGRGSPHPAMGVTSSILFAFYFASSDFWCVSVVKKALLFLLKKWNNVSNSSLYLQTPPSPDFHCWKWASITICLLCTTGKDFMF